MRKIKHRALRAAFLRRSDGGGDNQPCSPGHSIWRGNIGKAGDMAGQTARQPQAMIASGIVADIRKRAARLHKGLKGQTVGRKHAMPGTRRQRAGDEHKKQGKPGQKGAQPTDHSVLMHPRIKNGNGIPGTVCGPSGEVLWDLGCAAFPVQTSALCRVGPAM